MRRDVQDGDGGPPAQVSKLRGWLAEGGGGDVGGSPSLSEPRVCT